MEPQDLDKEELNEGTEDINVEGAEPVPRLFPYMPPWNPTSNITKDLDSVKINLFTLLLPDELPIEGELLAWVPYLKMEYLDLGNHEKFPQLEPTKYLKTVYYEEEGLTILEAMKWLVGIKCTGLINMVYVLYFSRSIIKNTFVCLFLALIHDGCL